MPFLHFNETNLKTNLLLNTEVIYIYVCVCVCVYKIYTPQAIFRNKEKMAP